MTNHTWLASRSPSFNVIASSPTLGLSGVNTFTINLMRGLKAYGVQSRIVLTEADRFKDIYSLSLPTDILGETLSTNRFQTRRARWQAMIQYLESRSPCIYLPNYDFQYSCISPLLSGNVGIVGIVHSDDPVHYEHVTRLGKYWNAIVAVSQTVAQNTLTIDPTLESRLVTIPYGVEVPDYFPEHRLNETAPLKIVYVGRLVQPQKRVLDLPYIVAALVKKQIPVELTIVGNGLERRQLVKLCNDLGVEDNVKFLGLLPNEQIYQVLKENDVFILTSDFEGLPLSLLEAMAWGCIPVVTDIRSGIPELVLNGLNGYRVTVGNIQEFAERLALLQRNPVLRRTMSDKAYQTICTQGYRVEDMAQRYFALFEQVFEQIKQGNYHRPTGKIIPPPLYTWKDLLPGSVRAMGRYIFELWKNRS